MNKNSISNIAKVDINDNCFDIIRIACTFTVFFGHFLAHFAVDNSILHGIAYFVRGVPVFFFLSGLFIARSLEMYNKKEFLVKRVFRIFPELWVCVLINLVFILCSIDNEYKMSDILIYLASQLTIFQFYTGQWLREYGVGVPNGALWTITVTIQFYIAALLFGQWLKGKSLKSMSFIVLGLICIDLLLEKCKAHIPVIIYKLLQCNLIPFLWIFLIGMMIYYFRDKIVFFAFKFKYLILCAYLTWQYLVPSQIIRLFSGIRYNIITTLLLLLLVTAIGFSSTMRFKKDYSYSFYLYHMVVINVIINNCLRRFKSYEEFICCLIVTILCIGILALLSQNLIGNKLTKFLESKLKSINT